MSKGFDILFSFVPVNKIEITSMRGEENVSKFMDIVDLLQALQKKAEEGRQHQDFTLFEKLSLRLKSLFHNRGYFDIFRKISF